MKYAPTIAKHFTLDPERTKRHMLRSTPDHLTLPHDEHAPSNEKFLRWVRNWATLHNVREPVITLHTTRGYNHFTISER